MRVGAVRLYLLGQPPRLPALVLGAGEQRDEGFVVLDGGGLQDVRVVKVAADQRAQNG